jgi:hypothetical protein
MNPKRERALLGFALAAVTIACGFIAWWSFVIVAFVSAFYLQRRFEALGPIRLATFAPATGWLFACLIDAPLKYFRRRLRGGFSLSLFAKLLRCVQRSDGFKILQVSKPSG